VLAGTPSLLITDDDATFRDTLRGVFEAKFHLLEASDGDEALSIVQRSPVHVLIADMHMPRLTGLEMIRQVHALNPQLPCILLSAQADDWLIEQARDAQVFSLQAKPVSRRRITGLVSDALRLAYGWTPSEV
jgi:CheY-like chemotaxis protein